MDEDYYSTPCLSLPLVPSAGLTAPRPPDEPLPDLSDRCVVCGSSAIQDTIGSPDPVCPDHADYPGPPVQGEVDPILRAARHRPLTDDLELENLANVLLSYGTRGEHAAFRLIGAAHVLRGQNEKWVEYHYGIHNSYRLAQRLAEEGLNALSELW